MGIGIKGPNYKLTKSMGTFPFIYQGKVHAIETCVNEINNIDQKGVNICILFDSQKASKAIQANVLKSKITWHCLHAIKKVVRKNKVTLVRISD